MTNSAEMPGLPILAVVVPCFNEEDTIGVAVATLLGHLDGMVAAKAISPDSFFSSSTMAAATRPGPC